MVGRDRARSGSRLARSLRELEPVSKPEMQTGEYEIRRLTTFRVEFDGRIAAVAWEESNDTCKTQDDAIVLHVRLVLPTRACGANSTPEGEADTPPELLSSCSKRP